MHVPNREVEFVTGEIIIVKGCTLSVYQFMVIGITDSKTGKIIITSVKKCQEKTLPFSPSYFIVLLWFMTHIFLLLQTHWKCSPLHVFDFDELLWNPCHKSFRTSCDDQTPVTRNISFLAWSMHVFAKQGKNMSNVKIGIILKFPVELRRKSTTVKRRSKFWIKSWVGPMTTKFVPLVPTEQVM